MIGDELVDVAVLVALALSVADQYNHLRLLAQGFPSAQRMVIYLPVACPSSLPGVFWRATLVEEAEGVGSSRGAQQDGFWGKNGLAAGRRFSVCKLSDGRRDAWRVARAFPTRTIGHSRAARIGRRTEHKHRHPDPIRPRRPHHQQICPRLLQIGSPRFSRHHAITRCATFARVADIVAAPCAPATSTG